MITTDEILGNVAPALPGNSRKVIRWDDAMSAREEREKRARTLAAQNKRVILCAKLGVAEAKRIAARRQLAEAEARITAIMAEFARVQE